MASLLVFYYSGHADESELELGDSSLTLREIAAFLRNRGGDVRIAFVDACESGRLVATRGGHRAPAYPIALSDDLTSAGYALITSSREYELSQAPATTPCRHVM